MDGTYAPQSPDLSSFLPSPKKTQQPYHPQSSHSHNLQPQYNQLVPQPQSASYAPRSPVLPTFNPVSQQLHHQNFHSYQSDSSEFEDFNYATAQGGYMPPIPPLPSTHEFPITSSLPSIPQFYTPQTEPIPSYHHQPNPTTQPPPIMSARGPRIKAEQSMSSAPPPQYQNPNPNNINITTKFPVARIKRIMQADEEVGKVSQVTPIAVSKALELFMIALVEGSAEKARERGAKKVGGRELKEVVVGNQEKFDFLNEILGRVKDAPEGAGGEGKKSKREKVKDEEGTSEEEERKVKKRGGRRKKSEE